MLYAFVAGASSSSPVWSVNLAQIPNSQGTPVDCRNWPESCQQNNSPIYPYLGITGTPVVDPNAGILYVVTWVQLAVNPYNVQYYLHAINITNGQEKTGSPVQVAASLSAGLATTPAACTTGSGPGPLTFNPRHHLQRTGLLLLSLSNGTPVIYIGFNPIRGELQNGWILGYSYNTGTGFSTTPVAAISTTPYGTGGGVWGAGTGLASDGSYIFASTGNGTFDANNGGSDYGDRLLKLAVNSTTGALSVSSYFTPSDWNTRCGVDLDFGSGGILLFFDSFFQGHPDLMVSADKESYLWIVDRDTLGGVNGQVEQTMQPSNAPQGSNPGYWSSPAYWKYSVPNGFQYNLYYAADAQALNKAPLPLNMYALATSGSGGPIPTGPTASTKTLFCGNPHAPTPSISANGATANSGIVWAIESSNSRNVPTGPQCNGTIGPAVLHAYNATPTTPLTELYNSSGLQTTVGQAVNFPTPTVFKGRLYMGTKSEVDVFGLCPSGGCPLQ
jgi:hypothetical protein